MIVDIYFDFFLDAKSAQGKEKISKKILNILIGQYGSSSIEIIENNKYIVSLEAHTWENLIFRLIEFSQIIGKQWIITGSIHFEFSLWSNDSKIIGVSSVGIHVDNLIE